MDLYKAIRDLYEQKKRLDLVIASLEELERREAAVRAAASQKRRGRPKMDDAARQEVSRRMKKYWAKQRKTKGPASVQSPPA